MSEQREYPCVNYRIADTRITVWDVLHHLDNDWTVREIAEVFCLSPAQVQAAVDYIGEHEDEVRNIHRRIEERNASGNSAEVEDKLARARAKRLVWLTEQGQKRPKEADCVGSHA